MSVDPVKHYANTKVYVLGEDVDEMSRERAIELLKFFLHQRRAEEKQNSEMRRLKAVVRQAGIQM